MRCYLIVGGHIRSAVELTATSDAEAIEEARVAFRDHGGDYDGFEVWHGPHMLYRCGHAISRGASA